MIVASFLEVAQIKVIECHGLIAFDFQSKLFVVPRKVKHVFVLSEGPLIIACELFNVAELAVNKHLLVIALAVVAVLLQSFEQAMSLLEVFEQQHDIPKCFD